MTLRFTTCIISVLIGLGWSFAEKPPLAQDSARFAGFYTRLQAGDTAAAIRVLSQTEDSISDHAVSRTNFLLASLFLEQGKFGEALEYLAREIPTELTDHATRYRITVLSKQGRDSETGNLWRALVTDSCSVYVCEACLALAKSNARSSDTLPLQNCENWCVRNRCTPEDQQVIQRFIAESEAAEGEHAAAVERLRSALLAAPSTNEAKTIRELLTKFRQKYGYTPRDLTPQELSRECEKLAEANANKTGLQRVQQLMQSPLGPAHADLLTYYKGRFESGLRRHRDAIATLRDHGRRFPGSALRNAARYYLGRSAYFLDQDTLAISSLTQVMEDSSDVFFRGRALDLLGILYRDRHRYQEAARAYLMWDSLGGGSDPECLWRLGWALWEADRKPEAAKAWLRLAERDLQSDWTPGAYYWSARAFQAAGQIALSDSLELALEKHFPFSYYSVINPRRISDSQFISRPLNVPSLDEIASSGGDHARRFAFLAAMRLPELALREWPSAADEMGNSDGMQWWKAQLHLWNQDRPAAWSAAWPELGVYVRSAGERPSDFLRLIYPFEYAGTIVSQAQRYGLDPYFVMALICQESHYHADAVSSVGAVGLMQLMPATAKREARKLGLTYSSAKLRDPEFNLQIGIAHLAHLFADFDNDTVLVLAAYNAGPSAAQAWYEEFGNISRDAFIERIPYRETRLFVKRNIEHQAAYRRLYPNLGIGDVAKPTR